jgi:hypothetical protein
MEEIQ